MRNESKPLGWRRELREKFLTISRALCRLGNSIPFARTEAEIYK